MKKQIVKKQLVLESETLSRMQLARVSGGDGATRVCPDRAVSRVAEGCPRFAVTHVIDGCPKI